MSYEILISLGVEKRLKKFDKDIQKRITDTLDEIKENPNAGKWLQYDLSGLKSYRIGKLRIVFEVDEAKKQIKVHDIDHRKNVYK